MDCHATACKSVFQIQRAVLRQAQRTEPGLWIRGVGYDDSKTTDKRILNRWDLDEVAPVHPVFIQHISGHWAVTNSKGLEAGNVREDTPDPRGGPMAVTPGAES